MPAAATVASKPAAPKPRSVPPTRVPAKATPAKAMPGPRSELASPAPPAKMLPAFARSALAPPGPATPSAARSVKGKTASTPKPRAALATLVPKRDSKAPGQPLAPHIKEAIENSLSVDLDSVRLHAGTDAENAAGALSARAFTFGSDIVLGKREHPSDLGLIAHEAAHVIQQQAGPTLQKWSADRSDRCEREADRAAFAVQRGESFTVRERVSSPQVQRWGISDAFNFFADQANIIPGFRMLTIILGVNPINMSHVDRNAANILRALVEFIPGGGLIVKALDGYGIFDKVGTWIEQQIQTLAMTGQAIKDAVTQFLKSLSWSDIFDLGGVWERAKHFFSDPIDRIINFAKGLVSGIIQFIKDAILRPIAKLAEGTAGYDLLKAVLGKDPITDEPYAPTAENVVGPFMRLIHEEEIWENMKKANAIPRAWAWFQSALKGLMGFVRQIPTLFINAFKALELEDIILVPQAFAKLANVFGGFLADFTSWAGGTIWNLLEIIFDVVSPGALSYIKKTGAALKSILKNPLPFVGNLVKAGKLGFQNFADNFGTHLKAGLIDWLTGSLPGVYIPKAFELREILKFVLSVLGLTWENVRQKLVKAVGETAVKAMETGFDIVVTLVTQGPAAAWDKIKDQLSNLKDMVIGGITDFVVDMVVKKAVPKIVSMFIPGAGFISAILSIYDTVMVFVEKISKIIQVVTAFIDSIVAIAGGAIGAAAARVESTLAGLLSLAISFLAGFAGLGKVADKVMGVIQKIRAPIDKALDWLVNWIVAMAKKLGKFVAQAGVPKDPNERLKLATQSAITIARRLTGHVTRGILEPAFVAIRTRYGLTEIQPYERGGTWWVKASINPGTDENTGVGSDPASAKATEEGSLVIAVISTKKPRTSTIRAEDIPRLSTVQTSPAHFELETTRQIVQVTGLQPETRARFVTKESREPGGAITVVSREVPPGFTTSPGGELLLPTTPRLFGTLSGVPKTRDVEEPAFEVRAGDLRKRGMPRHPDALLVTPQQIEPLEFTLDASLSLRGPEQTRGATPHKLLQIPGTVENVVRTFPRDTPVVYTVFVRGAVPQQRIDELERFLKRIPNIDVTVIFIRR